MPFKDPEKRRIYSREQMRRLRGRKREHYNRLARECRARKKQWIDSQKVQCVRCGETHIACLDFHHRNPDEKDFLVSIAVSKYPLDRIKEEVAKCDVLCANCHRKLHYEEKMAAMQQ